MNDRRRWMMVRWCLAVLLLLGGVATTTGATVSDTGRVIVLYNQASEVHREFLQGFAVTISDRTAFAQVAVRDQNDVTAALAGAGPTDLVVTVGSRIFLQVAEEAAEPDLLAAFLPRATYEHVVATLSPGQRARISAVFLDQPPEKQLTLARELCGEVSAVGVVISEKFADSAQRLAEVAGANGVSVKVETIRDEADVSRAFAKVLKGVDATLAIPDPLLLNRNNTKWFLYMAFLHKVPVIGFSEAFVKAGALAAVFSTPAQVGQQVAERVEQWAQAGWDSISGAISSSYLKVATNETVAHGLGLTLPPADVLEQRLNGL